MIIDVAKFVSAERLYWVRLEGLLDRIESDPESRLDMAGIKELHYLYERTSADLARVSTFASEREIRVYLESLVARAYAEMQETGRRESRMRPISWFFTAVPQTFRRRITAFWLAVAATTAGATLGILVTVLDPASKGALIPFEHLRISPQERVAEEETGDEDRLAGHKASFATALMTHNARVAVLTLALGVTWGLGTIVVLFYNGAVLGAVGMDYIMGGQREFLLGWLLPHGVVEIPAVLIAGQAGFVLARALVGYGDRTPIRARLRLAAPDIVTLIITVAVLLVWAGFVEAYVSQHHQPALPYALKIGFGLVELAVLVSFLAFAGRRSGEAA
ncbi:MAG: stage II sporulation protein M [Acidobacteriota bacterium]